MAETKVKTKTMDASFLALLAGSIVLVAGATTAFAQTADLSLEPSPQRAETPEQVQSPIASQPLGQTQTFVQTQTLGQTQIQTLGQTQSVMATAEEVSLVQPLAFTLPDPVVVPGGPEMVVVPPGSFLIGSPANQKKRDRNEGPQVPVTIDYAFEIGRYEVTFAEWRRCVDAGGCQGYLPGDNGWGRGDRPVTNISYNDVQSYIEWINAETGLTYRLPSEAEWEYVAREGRQLPFSTMQGLSISDDHANFNGKFPYGPNAVPGDYRRQTVPVGSYDQNDFGVHDIHGNVYEFVSDCYVETHKGNPGDGSPRRDGDCNARIIRGGSWVTHGYQMRAAKRLRYTMDHRYDDFGFRLARTIQ